MSRRVNHAHFWIIAALGLAAAIPLLARTELPDEVPDRKLTWKEVEAVVVDDTSPLAFQTEVFRDPARYQKEFYELLEHSTHRISVERTIRTLMALDHEADVDALLNAHDRLLRFPGSMLDLQILERFGRNEHVARALPFLHRRGQGVGSAASVAGVRVLAARVLVRIGDGGTWRQVARAMPEVMDAFADDLRQTHQLADRFRRTGSGTAADELVAGNQAAIRKNWETMMGHLLKLRERAEDAPADKSDLAEWTWDRVLAMAGRMVEEDRRTRPDPETDPKERQNRLHRAEVNLRHRDSEERLVHAVETILRWAPQPSRHRQDLLGGYDRVLSHSEAHRPIILRILEAAGQPEDAARAVPFLAHATEAEDAYAADPPVRVQAARVLARIGDRAALELAEAKRPDIAEAFRRDLARAQARAEAVRRDDPDADADALLAQARARLEAQYREVRTHLDALRARVGAGHAAGP